ncbi:efflux transporter MFP subunit [Azospirillum sp. B510]|uniref:efflux RND transporter periplasmic adaptor subunit n=1 Tax=Azospirillum sp. (strain B510) TaxID=137722 RepID=UPI0001C4C37B|nr:efflux RND transporter periplasmic adaptor subunit [Azospirillum sp. B510]BAI72014.1 efflux transporter MFP subunit [Azospirillum sp. B510]
MGRRAAIMVGVAFSVAAALSAYIVLARAEPGPAYRLARVEQGPLVSTITATGTMSALVTVEVSSQLSGQIAELYADFNSRVTSGQILARLNGDQLAARLAQAGADVDSAKASLIQQQALLDKARADLANAQASVANADAQIVRADLAQRDAERDLRRRRDLQGRGVVAAADLEKAETAAHSAQAQVIAARAQKRQAEAAEASAEASLAVAVAQVEVARAQVAQREAALQLVRVDVNRSVIRSPIDGVVVNRAVSTGQTVAASLSAPTLFTIAQDLRQMEVLANIDEADIGRVREGMPVRFTVNAFPGDSFIGRVAQVRLAPKEDQTVVTYIVVITVENPELRLLPGMTANLRITVEERPAAVKLPNAALRFRPPGARPPGAEAPVDAPAPTTGGPNGGRGAAALEAAARRVMDGLKLDETRRRDIAALVAEARDRFTALDAEGGDPERRRVEANAIRAATLERIAALIDPAQRDRFAALVDPGRTAEATRTVWVPGPGDGVPVGVPVRLGIGDGSFTELVAGDLRAGQDVITGLLAPDRDGRRGPRLGF